MKKKILTFLRVGVSGGLLGLLFWIMRKDVCSIWGILSHSNLNFIFIGVFLTLINTVMLALRLKIIFEGENLRISLWRATQLTYIGYYFNNFMPTAVGGDIVKAHCASGFNKKKVESYASVLMDRLMGLYTFLIIAAVALVINRGSFQLRAVKVMVICFLFLGIFGIIIAGNKRVAVFMERFLLKLKMFGLGERLNAVYKIVHDYRNRKTIILKGLSISIFAQCIYFVVTYLFFLSLGKEVGIGNVFLIMPLIIFISMTPSVGGLGVREGAIVALFAPLTGKETAFAVSLLILLGLFIMSLIGGVIYFWWGIKKEGNVD